MHTNQHNIRCGKLKYITLTALSSACLKRYKRLCMFCMTHVFLSIQLLVRFEWLNNDYYHYSKKKTLRPFFKDGVRLSQDYIANTRRKFTFYHKVPRSYWYSFGRPPKNKKLSRPWSHPVFFNLRPLDSVPQPLGINTRHENQNQITTLTTSMNRSQVYFHLLVFIVTLTTSPYDQITNVKLWV